jgi:hypothetical protein
MWVEGQEATKVEVTKYEQNSFNLVGASWDWLAADDSYAWKNTEFRDEYPLLESEVIADSHQSGTDGLPDYAQDMQYTIKYEQKEDLRVELISNVTEVKHSIDKIYRYIGEGEKVELSEADYSDELKWELIEDIIYIINWRSNSSDSKYHINYKGISSHTESWETGGGWLQESTYHTKVTTTTGVKDYYTHTLKADYPITIEFVQQEDPGVTINSKGNVNITGNIIEPEDAHSIELNSQGSVVASDGVGLFGHIEDMNIVGDIKLSIERQEQPANITATGNIDLTIFSEDNTNKTISVGNITSTGGNVAINAGHGISMASQESIIRGNRIVLQANEGDIHVIVDSSFSDIGGVAALADGNISIVETTGNLLLTDPLSWDASIESISGDITLEAAEGSIQDGYFENNLANSDIDPDLLENIVNAGYSEDKIKFAVSSNVIKDIYPHAIVSPSANSTELLNISGANITLITSGETTQIGTVTDRMTIDNPQDFDSLSLEEKQALASANSGDVSCITYQLYEYMGENKSIDLTHVELIKDKTLVNDLVTNKVYQYVGSESKSVDLYTVDYANDLEWDVSDILPQNFNENIEISHYISNYNNEAQFLDHSLWKKINIDFKTHLSISEPQTIEIENGNTVLVQYNDSVYGLYQYQGENRNIRLTAQDYTNTELWQKITADCATNDGTVDLATGHIVANKFYIESLMLQVFDDVNLDASGTLIANAQSIAITSPGDININTLDVEKNLRIIAGGNINFPESTEIVTKGAGSQIFFQAGSSIHIKADSHIYAGLEMGQDGFVITGEKSDIQIIAGAEMFIEGDIAASQDITLISGQSDHIIDIADTIDQITGHLECQLAPDAAIVSDLENGIVSDTLKKAFDENNLTLTGTLDLSIIQSEKFYKLSDLAEHIYFIDLQYAQLTGQLDSIDIYSPNPLYGTNDFGMLITGNIATQVDHAQLHIESIENVILAGEINHPGINTDISIKTHGNVYFFTGIETKIAGTTQDLYDQLIIAGNATIWHETLTVKLMDDFIPDISDTFDIITFDTLTGGFGKASGIYGFGEGDRFLELEQSADKLQLVTTGFGNGDFIPQLPESEQDMFGMFISNYFPGDELSLVGDFIIGKSVGVSGGMYLEKVEQNLIKLSITDDAGMMTSGENGLRITSLDGGAIITDTGVAAKMVGDGTLVGVEDFTLSGTDMEFELNSTGAPIDMMIDYEGQQTHVSYDETIDLLRVTGDMEGDIIGFITISGHFGFAKREHTWDAPVLAVSDNVRAGLEAGPFFVGVDGGKLGLGLHADETFVVYAQGNLQLDVDDFHQESETRVTIQYNTSDDDYFRTVTIGDISIDMDVYAGGVAVSAEDVNINIADFLIIQGDFGFRKTGDNIEAVANDVTALAQAGEFRVGVVDASLGMYLNEDGTKAFEVSGSPILELGLNIEVFSFESITVRMNDTGIGYTGETLQIAEVSYTFDYLPASYDLIEIEVKGIELNLFDAFYVKGNIGFQQSSQSVVLADATVVDTDYIGFGGSDLEAFIGFNRGAPDAIGLSLEGVTFGAAIFTPKEDETEYAGLNWTAVVAQTGVIAPVGLPDGFVFSTDNIQVELNQVSGEGADNFKVIDFTHEDVNITIPTGSERLALTMDGSKGNLIRAQGEFTITVSEFFHVSGGIGFELSTQNISLSDGTDVYANTFLFGASNLNAFVGVNGPYDNPGAMGFALTDVDFGLALMTPADDADTRSWLSLKASVGSASFLGIPGLSVLTDSIRDFSVSINTGLGDDNLTVMHLADAPLEVPTGGTPIILDFDGADHELLKISGHIGFNVLDFFYIEGDIAFEKSSELLSLSDGTQVETNLLTVGASHLDAFVGVGGPGDQPGAIGLNLVDVNFALALLKPSDGQDTRSWMSMVVDVESAGFVGVEGLTLNVNDLKVQINTGNETDTVADFSEAPLEVMTGEDTSVNLTFDGNDGQQIKAEGDLEINVFDFFYVNGIIAIETQKETLTLNDGSSIESQVLTIGASNDLDAFVGVGGPGDAPGALGLALSDVNFALGIMKPDDTADDRSWISLKANVGNAAFVGVDSITLSVSDLAVEINQGIGENNNVVVDYAQNPLMINTGGGNEVAFDFDGSKGQFMKALGRVEINLFDFFIVEGSIAFENRTETITLSDDSTVDANLLTIGASEDLDAFVGVGGPGDQPGALGLNLDNVNFALALMKPVDTQDDRSWTSLKADVGQAAFVGVENLTMEVNDFSVSINQSSTDVVADLKTAPLTVETGPETSILLDFDGSEGQLLKAQGNIVLNVFNFFYVEGNLAFENSAETITLSDGSSIETNLLTIGASGLDAFAGINGPTDNEGAFGLGLEDVNFALALMKPQNGEDDRSWTSLKADVGQASIVGIPSVTMDISEFEVKINQGATLDDDIVADFSTTPLTINTGFDNSITLDFDGSEGPFIKAEGTILLSLFDFFYVEGRLAFENSTELITLSDSSTVDTNLLTIGASDLNAFVGVNGPGDNLGALGLSLSDVNFGLALMKPKDIADDRSWTAMKADAGEISFVGVEDLTMSVTQFSVAINQADGENDVVADFADTNLPINIGFGQTIDLDFDGDKGELLKAEGNVLLNVFNFLYVEGTLAFENATETITLSDQTTIEANLLTIGASNDLDAFVGVGGPGDQPGALGLSLADINFGLAIIKPKNGEDDRSWTSVKANAGEISFVGVENLTLSVTDFEVSVNQSNNDDAIVADYSTTPLEIDTGLGNSIILDFDGQDGNLLKAQGHVTINVFDFFYVEGDLAFENKTETIALSDGSTVDTNLLAIGASENLEAFVGVNGPADTPGALGLSLESVNFALALMKPMDTSDTRSWTALKADVGGASFIGVEDLTLAVNDLSVDINMTNDGNDTVADFKSSPLYIETGDDKGITLDFDGQKGALLKASGSVEINLFNFFYVKGNIAFENSSKTIAISDGTTVDANMLTIGASELDAFVGANGPADTPGAMGFALSDISFALALMKPTDSSDTRSWTSLKAYGQTPRFIGAEVDGFKIEADELVVEINQGDGETVADFSSENLLVDTGGGNTINLDFDGDDGELLKVSGNVDINLFNFFYSSGYVAFESRSETISLSNGTTVETNLMTVGASEFSAFVGINGPMDNEDAIGFGIDDLSLGLALMKPKDGSDDRFWTSLKADVNQAGFVGMDDAFSISVEDLIVGINVGPEDETVADFSTTPLIVDAGGGNSVKLDFDGSHGTFYKIEGHMDLNLFNFFHASGNLAFHKYRQSIDISDGSTIEADMLTIGVSEFDAFAGINGPADNEGAIGFALHDADFALALMSAADETDQRTWTSLYADVNNPEFVGAGIEGINLTIHEARITHLAS